LMSQYGHSIYIKNRHSTINECKCDIIKNRTAQPHATTLIDPTHTRIAFYPYMTIRRYDDTRRIQYEADMKGS
jgi:hypothetical protein